jgi:hypothetical protein
MKDHLKDAINVSSMISTLANYLDDTNTSQRLCSLLLNEFNYLLWSRAIVLGGRFKLGFINSFTISPEVNDLKYEA